MVMTATPYPTHPPYKWHPEHFQSMTLHRRSEITANYPEIAGVVSSTLGPGEGLGDLFLIPIRLLVVIENLKFKMPNLNAIFVYYLSCVLTFVLFSRDLQCYQY